MYVFKRKQNKENDAPSKVELDDSLRKDPRCFNMTFSLRTGILAHCTLVLIFNAICFLMSVWFFSKDKPTKEPVSCNECSQSLLSMFRITIPILSVSFNVVTFLSKYNYLVGLIGSYFESILFISIYKYCRFINLLEFIVTSVEVSFDTPKLMERVHIVTDFDEETEKKIATFFVCLGMLIPLFVSLAYKLFLTYKVVQYQRLLERCQFSKRGA